MSDCALCRFVNNLKLNVTLFFLSIVSYACSHEAAQNKGLQNLYWNTLTPSSIMFTCVSDVIQCLFEDAKLVHGSDLTIPYFPMKVAPSPCC